MSLEAVAGLKRFSSRKSMDNHLVPSASQQNLLSKADSDVEIHTPHSAEQIDREGESREVESSRGKRGRPDIASVPRKGLTDAKKGMIPLLPGDIGEEDSENEEVEEVTAADILGPSTSPYEREETPPRLSTLMIASTPTEEEMEDSIPVSPNNKVGVTAVFDFDGVEEGDLPFREGDVFQADGAEFGAQVDGGWVTGWHNGQVGVFPSNYVVEVKSTPES